MKKYFSAVMLVVFFSSSPSPAKPIGFIVENSSLFFQCAEESLAFLGDVLGNQLNYEGDRTVLEVQSFFFTEAVYTSIRLAPLSPNYIEETWSIKSFREGEKCTPVEVTINAGDDMTGGSAGISVHN